MAERHQRVVDRRSETATRWRHDHVFQLNELLQGQAGPEAGMVAAALAALLPLMGGRAATAALAPGDTLALVSPSSAADERLSVSPCRRTSPVRAVVVDLVRVGEVAAVVGHEVRARVNKGGRTQLRLRFTGDQSATSHLWIAHGASAKLTVTYTP